MLILKEPEHKYFYDGYPVIGTTEVIKELGFYRDYPEWARERGQLVHLTCEWWLKDLLDEEDLNPVLAGFLGGLKKFCAETGFLPELIEQILYSEMFGFAGKIDIFGQLFGFPSLIDIKPPNEDPLWAWQIGGYQLLVQEWLRKNGRRDESNKLRRYALKLYANSTYQLKPYTTIDDGNNFLNCLAVVKAKRILLKEAA